jgi:hypothetical protein
MQVHECQHVLPRDMGSMLTRSAAAAAPQVVPAAFPPAGGLFRVRMRRPRRLASLATPDSVLQDGMQGAPPPDAAETWVTVFGFQPEELETVLREFQVR